MQRFLVLLTACSAATAEQSAGPRGPHADEHLAIAEREDARAADLAHWPDARPDAPNSAAMRLGPGAWNGTWDTTAEHRRNARYHRTAAAQIEAEYEAACGDTPGAVASVSPLERYGIGGSATSDGTLVLLGPDAGPPERLLAELRCHRAWMMLGRTQMDDCPLDLPGLHVDAQGDANQIELTLSIDDKKLVPELQRRAAHDLEAAGHRHQH
ncbi:MAG: hypothetical protein ABI678_01570 [Kofleriaceae bacterium]